MESTGLASWLGAQMGGLGSLPPVALYLGLGVFVLVLSELASNTAVATMMMPIVATLARAVGQPPPPDVDRGAGGVHRIRPAGGDPAKHHCLRLGSGARPGHGAGRLCCSTPSPCFSSWPWSG
jgi:hypothetical protein